jgi:hypothetical protein
MGATHSTTCVDGSVGVLFGNGDGTFQPAKTYDTKYDVDWVSVADVNRDGKLDLLVTSGGNNRLGVLLGNGDGTFQAAVIYSSGGIAPYGVAAADVNGDGNPDLLVANMCNIGCTSGSANVLLGNGDGTFRAAMGYDSGGTGARSVAVADVNGDGKPDLLVANFFYNTVGTLLGNGDGTFQAVKTYGSGGSHATSLALVDVNGDGEPDVVVTNGAGTNYAKGAVGVLLNNTPSCTTPPAVTISATPKSLWPPNGQMMPVTFSGTITEAQTGCSITSAAYVVTDEYGKVQPSGTLALGPGGAYSITVSLQASRLGSDLDGRLYTITVGTSNNTGKTGSQSGMVIVPHDQGR